MEARINKKRAKTILEKTRLYKKNNPLKYKATNLVTYHLKLGSLKRDNCCVCRKLYGKEVKAEAHHSDYNKPLEITWLCRSHHRAWHRVFIAEVNE